MINRIKHVDAIKHSWLAGSDIFAGSFIGIIKNTDIILAAAAFNPAYMTCMIGAFPSAFIAANSTKR